MENAQNFETFVSKPTNNHLDNAYIQVDESQDPENRPPSKFKVTITNVVLGDPHVDFDMAFSPSVDEVYPGNMAIQNFKIEIFVSTSDDSSFGAEPVKTITKASAINEANPDSPILGNPMNSNLIPFRNQELNSSLSVIEDETIIGVRMDLKSDNAEFYGDGISNGSFFASVPYQQAE